MSHESQDDLDALLFSLPLEEAPADLRGSILAATVYRPAPAFSPIDVGIIGAFAAIMLWFAVYLLTGHGGATLHWLSNAIGVGLQTLENPSTFIWIALGGAVTAWLAFIGNFMPLSRGVARQ